jgi:predicted site-specific integrase-resolvase
MGRVEVVQLAEQEREDVVADPVAMVCSCCARRYGPRRAKRTTQNIVRELTSQEASVAEEQEQKVAADATR